MIRKLAAVFPVFKKRRAAGFALAAALLVSCLAAPGASAENKEPDAITSGFVSATQGFSAALLQNTFKNGENDLVSPASAVFALGMTANGAAGGTETAFSRVLGGGMSVGNLDAAYKAYAGLLEKKSGSTAFNMANSVWYRNEFKPSAAFLQKNSEFFGAAARALDFSDPNSVGTINGWVKNATDGKIDSIIDSLEPDDVMVLINALSFGAKWQKPFDSDYYPTAGSFSLDGGGTASVTYMTLDDTVGYGEDSNASAVVLPYDDGRFAFMCILPESGVTLQSFIKGMDASTIPDLLAAQKNGETHVELPQFSVTGDNMLNGALEAMGLGVAFDRDRADFSQLSSGSESLYISAVRQKTTLSVDELGTEASAATSVTIKTLSMPGQRYIAFDRPFVYAVVDLTTGLPVFLGAMEKPQSTLKPHEN